MTLVKDAPAPRQATQAALTWRSILVHAEVDGDRLTDEELVSNAALLRIGGD